MASRLVAIPTHAVASPPRRLLLPAASVVRHRHVVAGPPPLASSSSSRVGRPAAPRPFVGSSGGSLRFASGGSGTSTSTTTATKASTTPDPEEAQQRKSDHVHCVDLVHRRDLDGYLCGLLLPHHARQSYFAIRAFNVEVASVKDGGGLGRRRPRSELVMPDDPLGMGGGGMGMGGAEVDSTLASRLRMQWWRDAVAEMYDDEDDADEDRRHRGGPSSATFLSQTFASSRVHNPVVRELSRAVTRSHLTRRFLDRTIDARELDLDVRQRMTLDDAVQYGEETAGSLLYLSLECAGVRGGGEDHPSSDGANGGAAVADDDAAYSVASHVGVGVGLVTTLRSTVYRSTFGELAIPTELMQRHSVPSSILLNPPDRINSDLSPDERDADLALRGAVREMAGLAVSHLIHARGMQGSVPKEGRVCLLPAVGALGYLKRLEKVDYDLFHPDMVANDGLPSRMGRLGLTFALGRAWLTGVF